jgi:hypothetical protein
MIAFNEKTVVLKKKDSSLVSVAIDQLSKADREFLSSKEAADSLQGSNSTMQTWTMVGGLQVRGDVVDYGRRDITLQRRRGRIYVNDRRFDTLPGVYQAMIPRIVSHFENREIDGLRGLERWLTPQRGAPRTYTCEGVLLELENGDMYAVPFFFFSVKDQEVLRSGWEQWLAAEKDQEQRDHHAFLLQAQAEANQRDREQFRHVMQLQLELQAYQAGLFNLWEVGMFPMTGNVGPPLTVVVPGRNSDEAAAAAMQRNPGYTIAGIAQVSRLN